MKKKNKLMTICVTTANRAKELKKCLISLKKNDLAEVDIIIGDNSQDDKSKGVVKKIFPKAKYFINKPRTDEVKNTNKCFSFSKTPYILLLHDDDMLSDNFIAEVINAVKKYPDADIIYTARIMIDQNSVILKKHITNIPSEYIHYKAEKILDHYMLGNIITTYQVPLMTPGMIFKTQLYNKTGGLNSKIDTHYDTEFIYKILALSKKLLLINKPIYLSTVWNGFSGRTKSSERGVVYFAQKGVIDSFIEFCKK
ncbi:MAG: glycosyltransferase family A protein, partial [Candidatus Roizmanbacteria bacterium]|nr:glycosyltransferase family A protein [Candidatus Roizmanbacteria bacterium]